MPSLRLPMSALASALCLACSEEVLQPAEPIDLGNYKMDEVGTFNGRVGQGLANEPYDFVVDRHGRIIVAATSAPLTATGYSSELWVSRSGDGSAWRKLPLKDARWIRRTNLGEVIALVRHSDEPVYEWVVLDGEDILRLGKFTDEQMLATRLEPGALEQDQSGQFLTVAVSGDGTTVRRRTRARSWEDVGRPIRGFRVTRAFVSRVGVIRACGVTLPYRGASDIGLWELRPETGSRVKVGTTEEAALGFNTKYPCPLPPFTFPEPRGMVALPTGGFVFVAHQGRVEYWPEGERSQRLMQERFARSSFFGATTSGQEVHVTVDSEGVLWALTDTRHLHALNANGPPSSWSYFGEERLDAVALSPAPDGGVYLLGQLRPGGGHSIYRVRRQ